MIISLIFMHFKFYLFTSLILKFTYFGCSGSSLLCTAFLLLWRGGLFSSCSVRASHCFDFSCSGAWALGAQASVVVAPGLSFSMLDLSVAAGEI